MSDGLFFRTTSSAFTLSSSWFSAKWISASRRHAGRKSGDFCVLSMRSRFASSGRRVMR
jgi:hypothetical protein